MHPSALGIFYKDYKRRLSQHPFAGRWAESSVGGLYFSRQECFSFISFRLWSGISAWGNSPEEKLRICCANCGKMFWHSSRNGRLPRQCTCSVRRHALRVNFLAHADAAESASYCKAALLISGQLQFRERTAAVVDLSRNTTEIRSQRFRQKKRSHILNECTVKWALGTTIPQPRSPRSQQWGPYCTTEIQMMFFKTSSLSQIIQSSLVTFKEQ